jgi:hypothetical protein
VSPPKSFDPIQLVIIKATPRSVEIASMQLNKKEDNMKKIGLILVVFAFLVYWTSTGQSQEVSPKVGDNAPDFSLVDASGNEIRLGDFKGKKIVALIFYAEDS